MKFKGIEGNWVTVTKPEHVNVGDFIRYTGGRGTIYGEKENDPRTVTAITNQGKVSTISCQDVFEDGTFTKVEVFVPSPTPPKQLTPKEQIVENTKKSITIATSLIQKNLEGLGKGNRHKLGETQDYYSVQAIHGLIDFLKNELDLYQKNMDSANKVESFTNQLTKGE